MNKLTLAVLLALSAVTAQAESQLNFIKMEAVNYSYQSSPNDKTGVNLQVGHEIQPGVKIDVKQEFRVEENTKKISNRFEGGVAYEEKIPFVTVGVRGAIGEKYTSGDNYSYYLVEPSVAYDVTDTTKVKVSYRYRDAFDSAIVDRTNTYKVGVDYKLAYNTIIGASVGKTTGDSEYTSLQGGLTYKF